MCRQPLDFTFNNRFIFDKKTGNFFKISSEQNKVISWFYIFSTFQIFHCALLTRNDSIAEGTRCCQKMMLFRLRIFSLYFEQFYIKWTINHISIMLNYFIPLICAKSLIIFRLFIILLFLSFFIISVKNRLLINYCSETVG